MPPRVPCPIPGLKTFALCLRPAVPRSSPAASLQPLVQTANLSLKEKRRKAKRDPYWWQQSQQRIAANKKRQAELQAVRDAEWGDKVHGITTPFVESFDSAGQASLSTPPTDTDGNKLEEAHELPTSRHVLNYQLSREELDSAIKTSYNLTKPMPSTKATSDPNQDEAEAQSHEEAHQKAVEALRRITALDNGSSGDRRHANVRRCIETFGRHNTDKFLRPKPVARGAQPEKPVPRAGPDTGSSEVQIAILTAKIRVLAKAYEGRKGNKDKANKRNLRLLCHRRQKLMAYMERKERGSERWTHMLTTLGLSPATWKQQIAIE